MIKIAAFLKFNKEIEKEVFSLKKIVKKKYGNQKYLNHPIHSTLFVINVKNEKVIKKLLFSKSDLKSKKKIKININKTDIFENDILTNGHTLFFNIKKNNILFDTQKKLLNFFKDVAIKDKEEEEKFKLSWMKKNYNLFGFPYVGDNWIPHITIASISNININDIFLKNFKKKKIKFTDNVSEVFFYRINNENHKYLFKFKIF